MAIDPELVRDALRGVIDPEIGIDIVDLGLVHAIAIHDDRVVVAVMPTSPACPMIEYLKGEIARIVSDRLPAGQRVQVEVVRDPPWAPERISPAGRRALGWPEGDGRAEAPAG
jgi:metal-sulfur cluster biosynthetic enzyme